MEDSCDIDLETYSQICGSISHILAKSFGPNALNILMTTSTGRVMITNSGVIVLLSLNMSHPVSHVIKNAVVQHCKTTGDGSKTFLFLMDECLRGLIKAISDSDGTVTRVSLSRAFNGLLQKGLLKQIIPEIILKANTCQIAPHSETFKIHLYYIIFSSLQGTFNRRTVSFIADILHKFLVDAFQSVTQKTSCEDLLMYLIDNFEILVVESVGRPLRLSHIVEGVLIQRNFSCTVDMPLEQVVFVLIGMQFSDEDQSCPPTVIYSAHTKSQLTQAMSWKVQKLKPVVDFWAKEKVNLIISSEHIPEIMTFLCRQSGISVIQSVDADELERLSHLSGSSIKYDIRDMCNRNGYGIASRCESIDVENHNWVILEGIIPNQLIKNRTLTQKMAQLVSKQIVLCGPSPGICTLYKTAMKNSLKCIRMWLEEPLKTLSTSELMESLIVKTDHALSVPAGGAFEIFISLKLLDYAKQCSDPLINIVSNILAQAFQGIPQMLLNNSYASKPERSLLVNLMREIAGGCTATMKGIDGVGGRGLLESKQLIEPLSSKIYMLFHVISLLQVLLRLDAVVNIKSLKPNKDEN